MYHENNLLLPFVVYLSSQMGKLLWTNQIILKDKNLGFYLKVEFKFIS